MKISMDVHKDFASVFLKNTNIHVHSEKDKIKLTIHSNKVTLKQMEGLLTISGGGFCIIEITPNKEEE